MNFDNTIFEGKGIFVFSDPAAENAILALVDDLILDGYIPKKDFLVYTNNLKKTNIHCKDILNVEDFNENKLNELILNFKPIYFFLGTSLNDYEHNWRKLGVKHNIRVISFIDHWTNYLERFSFNDELILGNEIWVVNEIAKKEAIRAGVPEKLIEISGNPYYKKVKEFKPKVSKDLFFKSHGLDGLKKTILFISDDIKRSFPKNKNGECKLGFDEYSVLKDILISMHELKKDINFSDFQLVIKLHPKSEKNKFKQLISDFSNKSLNVHCVRDCDSLTINYYSDFVLGMFSNMVVESILMQKKLLRIQTGGKFDLFKFNNLKPVTKVKDLKEKISDLLILD